MFDFPAQSADAYNATSSTVALGNRWKSDGTKWRSTRSWTLVHKSGPVATTPYFMFYLPPGYHHFELRVRSVATVTDFTPSIQGFMSYDGGATWGTANSYGQSQMYGYPASATVPAGGSTTNQANMGTNYLQAGWPSIYILRIYPGDADTYGSFNWTTVSYWAGAPGGILQSEGGSYAYKLNGGRATHFLMRANITSVQMRHNGYTLMGVSRA